MDVNKLMSSMQGTDYEAILKNLESMGGPMKNALMIASVISIVIGLLWCFFGLKLIRVWAAILGLALGFGIGTGVAAAFNLRSSRRNPSGDSGRGILSCRGIPDRLDHGKLSGAACPAAEGLEACAGLRWNRPGCGTVYDPLCGTDHHRDHRYQRRNECRHGNHILSAV